MAFDFESHAKTRAAMRNHIVDEMERAEEAAQIEEGLRAFVRVLEEGKMEIRAFPTANIHAKVYIGRYDSDVHYGHVITGSSNFTESGLIGQREFNVELKDRADVEFALEKFEELWAQGVEVTEDFVQILCGDTWLNDEITPYDIYLKFLYEYFEEDINLDQQEPDPLKALQILREHVPESVLDARRRRRTERRERRREVILSAYLQAK